MVRGARDKEALKRNEVLILEALQKEGRAMSAYDLIERLHGQGIASPPTAYRALRRLTEIGLVHRIESLNAFFFCSHARHADAAAFAICSRCGLVTEFHADAVGHELRSWAVDKGFTVERVVIEVGGRCAACSNSDGQQPLTEAKGRPPST